MDASLDQAVSDAGHGAECMARFGGENPKERLLSPIPGGRSAVAVAFVETHRVISPLPATTTLPDGGGWILNATKHFVSCAGRARVFLTLAALPPETDETAAARMFIFDD